MLAIRCWEEQMVEAVVLVVLAGAAGAVGELVRDWARLGQCECQNCSSYCSWCSEDLLGPAAES